MKKVRCVVAAFEGFPFFRGFPKFRSLKGVYVQTPVICSLSKMITMTLLHRQN
jgi:hypothetical protein